MKDEDIKLLVLLGGGAAAIWYITSYGPSGAVATQGGSSWWQTWFGGSSASGATVAATTNATTQAALSPATTSVTTPVTTPVASTPVTTPIISTPVVSVAQPTQLPASSTIISLALPAGFVVSPNINNSLSGYVLVNGMSANLTIITGNLGQPGGLIYDVNGNDITGQYTPAQQQALVAAYLSAPQNATAGIAGIAGLGRLFPMRRRGPGMGVGYILPASPFITPATNGVANPASLGMAGLTGLGVLGAIPRRRRQGWGHKPGGNVPTSGGYLQ